MVTNHNARNNLLSSFNSFPSWWQLDENSFLVNSKLLVEVYQLFCLAHHAINVKWKSASSSSSSWHYVNQFTDTMHMLHCKNWVTQHKQLSCLPQKIWHNCSPCIQSSLINPSSVISPNSLLAMPIPWMNLLFSTLTH